MTPAQQEIMDTVRGLELPVLGPTDPDLPALDGVIVKVGSASTRLDVLRESGYRLTPSGHAHTIVEKIASE